MANMQACLETGRQQSDLLMQGRALWQLGRLQGREGYHEQALATKLEGLALIEKMVGKDHLDVAKCCTSASSTPQNR